MDKSERSRCSESKPKNAQGSGSKSFDDFKAVYWNDGFYDWHDCAVCEQMKLTSWQAETFRDERLWLCEDCKTAWEKQKQEMT